MHGRGVLGCGMCVSVLQVHRRRLSQMQRNAPSRVYIVDHVYVRCYSGAQQAPQEVEILKNENSTEYSDLTLIY